MYIFIGAAKLLVSYQLKAFACMVGDSYYAIFDHANVLQCIRTCVILDTTKLGQAKLIHSLSSSPASIFEN